MSKNAEKTVKNMKKTGEKSQNYQKTWKKVRNVQKPGKNRQKDRENREK